MSLYSFFCQIPSLIGLVCSDFKGTPKGATNGIQHILITFPVEGFGPEAVISVFVCVFVCVCVHKTLIGGD
jgi:hypothetical protein